MLKCSGCCVARFCTCGQSEDGQKKEDKGGDRLLTGQHKDVCAILCGILRK
jgi:hypothetical protein